MNYDLEERTSVFSEKVIILAKKFDSNPLARPLIYQFIRSGTSIGANYFEANGASSSKDFRNKIFICKKEAQETKYWLRLLVNIDKNFAEECRILWKEAQELTLIFTKIASKVQVPP